MAWGRVVVADDHREIVVGMYAHGRSLATVVTPMRALDLARLLIEAALRHIEAIQRSEEPSLTRDDAARSDVTE